MWREFRRTRQSRPPLLHGLSLMVSVKDVVRAHVDEAAGALAAGDPLGTFGQKSGEIEAKYALSF